MDEVQLSSILEKRKLKVYIALFNFVLFRKSKSAPFVECLYYVQAPLLAVLYVHWNVAN